MIDDFVYLLKVWDRNYNMWGDIRGIHRATYNNFFVVVDTGYMILT